MPPHIVLPLQTDPSSLASGSRTPSPPSYDSADEAHHHILQSPTSDTSGLSSASSSNFPFVSSKSKFSRIGNTDRQGLFSMANLAKMVPAWAPASLPTLLRHRFFLLAIVATVIIGLTSRLRPVLSERTSWASLPEALDSSPSERISALVNGPENPTLRLQEPQMTTYTDGAIDIEAPVPWYKESLLARLAALDGKWLGAKDAAQGRGLWSGRQDVIHVEGMGRGGIETSKLQVLGQKELNLTGLPVFPRRPVVQKNAPEAKDLMFGMATSATRADSISAIWPHWLGPQPTSPDDPPSSLSPDAVADSQLPGCLVLLPTEDFKPLDGKHLSTSEAFQLRRAFQHPSRGLKHITLRSTELPHTQRYEVRYFALVKEMDRLAKETGRDPMWYIVGDDDTLWVDQRTLRRELGQYDADDKYFIGGNTEARNQYKTFGTMAYGGAGIIMSRGLHKAMVEIYDDCVEKLKATFGGDGIFTKCAVMAFGGDKTKEDVMTVHPGLHQMDVPGDGTGFFQSGLPFVSLHHMWNGWTDPFAADHPTPGFNLPDADINQLLLIARVARFLGGDNLFKRFVFGDGRELLCLGYSITLFEEPMVEEDLRVLEYTWSYDDYRLLWPHRPRIIEADTGAQLPANERGKDTYYISEIIYDEKVEPGKAILRHTDRWRRHVDVIWEEVPVDHPLESGARGQPNVGAGETTWRMRRTVRRRDLDGHADVRR